MSASTRRMRPGMSSGGSEPGKPLVDPCGAGVDGGAPLWTAASGPLGGRGGAVVRITIGPEGARGGATFPERGRLATPVAAAPTIDRLFARGGRRVGFVG